MKTEREEQVVVALLDYLNVTSFVEDGEELSPEQERFKRACDVCVELLKRTELIAGIVVKRPDEFREEWETGPKFEYMSKYAISTCPVADEVMEKI